MPTTPESPPGTRTRTRTRNPPRTLPWHFVYRIYDRESGALLYVGCTNDLRRRTREHHDNYVYRLQDVRYEFETVRTQSSALALERRMIRELEPQDNVRWVAKRDRPQ